MSRHVIDHTRPSDGMERSRKFFEIDRQSGLHPAIRALHQRPSEPVEGNSRLVEYTRIERGILA